MRLGIMREFVELGNCLSFSKAAKRLHLSQPALSMHVGKLEKDLGVTLVSRERPMHLTAAGRLFYDHAGKVLAMHDEVVAACRALERSSDRGQLRIKMEYAHTSIKTSFRQLVVDFQKLHPSIEVSFVSEMWRLDNLLENATGHKVNVWFFSTSCDGHVEAHEEAVGARSLLVNTSSLAMWMRPQNALRDRKTVGIRDLEGMSYPMPMGEQFAELRDAAMSIIDAEGVRPAFRNVPADSFEDYLFEVKDNEAFLMVEHPLDADRDHFLCKPLDPAIEHYTYLMVKADEENPALDLFLDYARENWTPTRTK